MENTPPNNTKNELEQLLADQTSVILGAVDQRLANQEDRIVKTVDERFQSVDSRFASHELRIDTLERNVDDKFDTVITKLDGVMKELQAHREEDVFGASQLRRHDDELLDHERRIKTLELHPQRGS